MSERWIAALPAEMEKAAREFKALVGDEEFGRLWRLVFANLQRDCGVLDWMQELYHERIAGVAKGAEGAEKLRARIAELELEADGNARSELERGHLATMLSAEQSLHEVTKAALAQAVRERAAAREAALEEAAAGLDKARAEAEEKAREAHAAKQYDNEGLWDFSAACLGIEAKVVRALKVLP